MNEKYRNSKGINFSKIAAYYNKGTYSPDHALMDIKYKSYFEYGKMFETMLQDQIQGSDAFGQQFYRSKLESKMPDKLIEWIKEDDLTEHYVFTAAGNFNNTYRNRHAYLDEAEDNPGKIPVSVPDFKMLETHTKHMLAMRFLGKSVSKLLEQGKWQVPIFWEDDNSIEKKALIDCLVIDADPVVIDIKTTANFKQFAWLLNDKYFLQDIHYMEGVCEQIKQTDNRMVFFVASKEPPYLCQPWMAEYQSMKNVMEEYNDLCAAYEIWVSEGRKPKGWLPLAARQLRIGG